MVSMVSVETLCLALYIFAVSFLPHSFMRGFIGRKKHYISFLGLMFIPIGVFVSAICCRFIPGLFDPENIVFFIPFFGVMFLVGGILLGKLVKDFAGNEPKKQRTEALLDLVWVILYLAIFLASSDNITERLTLLIAFLLPFPLFWYLQCR